MNIVFHAHKADVTDAVQRRAEQGVRKLGARLRRAVDASIRVAADGTTRRVEIEMRAPRAKPLVAVAEARSYEEAVGEALQRLEAQVEHLKDVRARRIRQARGAESAVLGTIGGAIPPTTLADDEDDDLLDLEEDEEGSAA